MFVLRKYLYRDAKLLNSSIHGTHHWKNVERNGVYLCQFNNADEAVVRYFAVLHDCMRWDDGFDKEHGPRAAKYAKRMRKHIPLDDEQFENLLMACRSHTFGKKAINETVATCWDSDRLDIGRIGVIPHAKFMTNEEAKRIADERDMGVLYNFKFQSLLEGFEIK